MGMRISADRVLLAVASCMVLVGCGPDERERQVAPAPVVHPATPRTETPAKPATEIGRPVDLSPEAPSAIKGEGSVRFGTPKAIAKPKGAVRVAVYNVENLFDDHDDPTLSGQQDDVGMQKPAEHLAAVAAAIRAVDADVIGLTEVESERALLWFRDAYLKDMGYVHHAAKDAGDERGIEQSVLSRFPITASSNWVRMPLGGTHPEKWGRDANDNAGQPIVFHRSPFLVTVQVPAEATQGYVGPDGQPVTGTGPYTLTVAVVHQKSGQPGGYMRDREAAKTVALLQERRSTHPDENVVIMGDFNARPDDACMKMFFDAGYIDLFAHRKRGDSSFLTHASGRTIDYILLSLAAEKELIRETRFIFGTPTRPQGADYRTTPPPEGYASDHYPVVMDLVPVDR